MGRLHARWLCKLVQGAAAALVIGTACAADKTANDRAFDEARALADKIEAATRAGAKPTPGGAQAGDTLPKGDPCALLTDSEIRKIYPKAGKAQPERTREKYGIAACLWEHPAGKLIVQLTNADPRSTGEEARGLASGFVDPLKPSARQAVRFEKLSGVGDEAVAVVERQDDKRGILSDAAYLITQRGERQVMVIAIDLAGGDRTAAIKTLEGLGRAAAGRL